MEQYCLSFPLHISTGLMISSVYVDGWSHKIYGLFFFYSRLCSTQLLETNFLSLGSNPLHFTPGDNKTILCFLQMTVLPLCLRLNKWQNYHIIYWYFSYQDIFTLENRPHYSIVLYLLYILGHYTSKNSSILSFKEANPKIKLKLVLYH